MMRFFVYRACCRGTGPHGTRGTGSGPAAGAPHQAFAENTHFAQKLLLATRIFKRLKHQGAIE